MLTDHELSALVAEKVYKILEVAPTAKNGFRRYKLNGMAIKGFQNYAIDQGLALDAALQVAWDVDIQAPDSDPSCRVKLLLRRPSQPEIAFGTTVARALCLAALRASGVEVEDDGEEGA